MERGGHGPGHGDAFTALVKAVVAAIGAGAEIENPHTHPMTLRWSGAWLTTLTQERMTEIVAADPGRLDQVLSWWQGHLEYLEHYRRALAEGNEQHRAWWRKRLLEDYNYGGPFPDDPPMVEGRKGES